MKKYKLTKKSIDHFGKKLFQIEAVASFGSVVKGELGGCIEEEANLEVYGNAWVSGNAEVSGNAKVYGNAWVFGKIKLSLGFFFGHRYKKEEIKYHRIDNDYEVIYKGDAKIEEGDDNSEKKAVLLSKADELIAKAEELKRE